MNDTANALGKVATDEAIARLRSAPAELLDLQKRATVDTEAARGWQPPHAERDNLTPDGILAERRRRRGDVETRVSKELDAIEQALNAGARSVAHYSAGAGQREKADPAAEAREDRTWNNKLRPLLDAGRGAANVIGEVTTLDEARALQRELPGWLMVRRQQAAQHSTESALRGAMKNRGTRNPEDKGNDDPAPFVNLINHKVAELLPPAEGARLRAALDAEGLTVGVRARVDALRRQYGAGRATGGANLRDSLAGAMAGRAAKARGGAPAA